MIGEGISMAKCVWVWESGPETGVGLHSQGWLCPGLRLDKLGSRCQLLGRQCADPASGARSQLPFSVYKYVQIFSLMSSQPTQTTTGAEWDHGCCLCACLWALWYPCTYMHICDVYAHIGVLCVCAYTQPGYSLILGAWRCSSLSYLQVFDPTWCIFL